mmetsp:Transcript_620/g.828  ORF Transcript_620/g.828 Transcript_620/m.828 type:complete len:227 (-) Transcript_620:321-1001(-)
MWTFSTSIPLVVVLFRAAFERDVLVDAFRLGHFGGENTNISRRYVPPKVSSALLLPRTWTERLTAKRDPTDNDYNNDWKPPAFVSERLQKADPLEIRLDTTLTSCYALCRFLIYDMSLPKKEIPGFEIADVVMLINAFTSAAVLAIYWVIAGIVTRNFEDGSDFDPKKLFLTAALAGPPWLATEILFRWPPGGVDEAAGAAVTIITGSLGLFSIMACGSALTSGWR